MAKKKSTKRPARKANGQFKSKPKKARKTKKRASKKGKKR